MDIEDDLGSAELGQPAGKDQEIRHVVDVEQVITFADVPAGDPHGGGEEETQDRRQI